VWRKGRIARDRRLTSNLQFSYDEQQRLAIAAFIYLIFVQFNTLHLFTRLFILSSFNDDFNSSYLTNGLFNNVFNSSSYMVSNGEYRIGSTQNEKVVELLATFDWRD
jgi:hypothetical protein